MIVGPLFKIGDLGIYPYGICMALGIISCFVFLYVTMTRKNFNDEAIDKMLLFGICATGFGVFMATVFQALYDYIEDPSQGYNLGSAMTFQGGLIGGVSSFLICWNLYIYVIAPRAKGKLLSNHMNASLSDAIPFVAPSITIAHAFGRLGCTFAGCCYGAETDAWYGLYMPAVGAKVIPTQLFECIFLVLLSVIMIILYYKFNFKHNFSVYLISYGVWRFLIEFLRDDHRGEFVAGLTPSQFWSLVMVVLGIGFIFLFKYVLQGKMKHPELQPKVDRSGKKPAEPVADGESAE